jgi:hypothetical protein
MGGGDASILKQPGGGKLKLPFFIELRGFEIHCAPANDCAN